MTGLAVGLIIAAAFLHATWNLLVKRVAGGGAFLWLVCVWSGLLYAPLAVWIIVAQRPIPPLVLDWGSNFGRLAFLSPLALRRWDDVRRHWRDHRLETIGVGALAPLAYILVLTALVFTRVSYVAPAREMSILVGTAMGTRLLAEGDAARRLGAGAAIVLGVAALALG
jgi:hypothetical protein